MDIDDPLLIILAVVVIVGCVTVAYLILKPVLWPKQERLCYECAERGQFNTCEHIREKDSESYEYWECWVCGKVQLVRR